EPGRTAGPNHAVDLIAMEVRRAAASTRRNPLAEHLEHFVEVLTRQVVERISAPHEVEQVLLLDLARCRDRHHLLRQDVEGARRNFDAIQLASAYGPDRRRGL